MSFNKTAVLGVGLIGASFASALKEKGICPVVIGAGRTESNLLLARDRGFIDDYCLDPGDACADADLVLLSALPGTFIKTVEKIRHALKAGCLVTDVGSVKGEMVYTLEGLMPQGVSFVGSHPIAGSHESGAIHANSRLFENALCIVTPTENTPPDSLEKVKSLWTALGCRIRQLDPYEHDEIYSLVSHFPHLLSYCLVNTVEGSRDGVFDFAGKGLKDMTRIAGSSPELWQEILMLNKDNIIKLIGLMKEGLTYLEGCLQQGDTEALKSYLRKAQETQRRISQG